MLSQSRKTLITEIRTILLAARITTPPDKFLPLPAYRLPQGFLTEPTSFPLPVLAASNYFYRLTVAATIIIPGLTAAKLLPQNCCHRAAGAELPEVLVVVVACAHAVERVGTSGLFVRRWLRLLELCFLVLIGCAPVEYACANKSVCWAL